MGLSLRQVAVEVVAKMLTHRSSVTTSGTYGHLSTADLRAELEHAGAWPAEVAWRRGPLMGALVPAPRLSRRWLWGYRR